MNSAHLALALMRAASLEFTASVPLPDRTVYKDCFSGSSLFPKDLRTIKSSVARGANMSSLQWIVFEVFSKCYRIQTDDECIERACSTERRRIFAA